MRNPAAQGRRDSNHAEVVTWYEQQFCSVVDTHTVGLGFPDLVVGIAGETCLVEIKTDHGHLEASQLRFHRDWRGSKVVVIRSQADVIRHVQQVRERVSRGNHHAGHNDV